MGGAVDTYPAPWSMIYGISTKAQPACNALLSWNISWRRPPLLFAAQGAV
jgi:hypothetical protein